MNLLMRCTVGLLSMMMISCASYPPYSYQGLEQDPVVRFQTNSLDLDVLLLNRGKYESVGRLIGINQLLGRGKVDFLDAHLPSDEQQKLWFAVDNGCNLSLCLTPKQNSKYLVNIKRSWNKQFCFVEVYHLDDFAKVTDDKKMTELSCAEQENE